MAANLTHRQTDSARQLIKVEKICLALQQHIDGDVEMKSTQINAARILLDKSLPSLIAQAISADAGVELPLLKIVKSNAA